MPGVMKRFFPKELVTTDDVVKHVNPTLVGILRDAQRQRARIETWSAGDRYRGGGGWEVEAIHPVSKRTPGPRASDNAKSLCLVIRYAGRTLFLPGDLEPPGTQQVIAQPSIDVDVMMAPHHGSLSAQAERVVAWANPEAIVISGSARAVSKRVVETYTPKGGRLWITARDHAVRIEIDASGRIRTLRWRSPHWEEIA
jgi:competence protein ComEC